MKLGMKLDMKLVCVTLARDPFNDKFGFDIEGDVPGGNFFNCKELRVHALGTGTLPKHNINMRIEGTPWRQVLPGDRIEAVNGKSTVGDMVDELTSAREVHLVFRKEEK